ncbi:hypothetical protein HYX08_05015 [Candidatus Woesearchaeota archaeon]|nr:hypothetical protein [Candidatus Woesearchaeota archaeon]
MTGPCLEVAMETARKQEIMGMQAIELNPLGGTYPILFKGNTPKWVVPVDGYRPASVELLPRRKRGDARKHHKVPDGATGVFFPDFHYEHDGNGKSKPDYGNPRFIPFHDFIGSPTA